MKKGLCILLCLLLVSLTAGALPETVKPVMPEKLRSLVAGKTFFNTRLEGCTYDENMENALLTFQICEQESYEADAVKTLQAGDTIVIGGDEFVIKDIKQDEFGYELTGELYTVFLYENEDGLFNAVSDTENRFYKKLFAIEVPAASDLRFLDWSDPEAEEPVVLTLKHLLTRYANEEIFSSEDNTEIIFDEDGNLTDVVYRYSPWN